jgi:hypothetical protein
MSISIDRESNYRTNSISGISGGGGDIVIEKYGGSSSSSNPIGGSSGGSPKLFSGMLPEKKMKFIPPQLSSKKVPIDSFGGLVNTRKTASISSQSSASSGEDPEDDSEEDFSTMSSHHPQETPSPVKNRYASSIEDEDSDSDSDSDGGDMSGSSRSGSDESSYVSEGSGTSEGSGSYMEPQRKSYEEIQREKQEILYELDRLQRQGFPPSKRYTMASTYEDMVYERNKLKKQRDVERSIKFQRKGLLMFASGVEFLNDKFDPFDLKLQGWSEKIMEDITDYDEIFEQLHEKYGEKVDMAPELKLLMTLGGSAFMFHLTNSIFKSNTPDMNDILKKNPDIMRSIQQASIQQMQNKMPNDPIFNMMAGNAQSRMGPPPSMETRPPQKSPIPQGPSRPMTSGSPQQPKMGSAGVDDLLRSLGGNSSPSRDEDSMSESSVNMRSFGKKTIKKNKTGGITLDFA